MMKFKRITAFLLILCMVMIGGCSQEEAVDPVKTAVQTAENYLFNKDYKNAAKAYEAMGGYGDAPLYTVYCLAMQALEDGKYENAYLSFDMLGDFLDSRFASVYAKALFNTESAKKEPECYLHAAEFFDRIPLYRDSAVRAENARLSLYKEAEKCLNAGEYELSAHYFALLEDYSDSAQMEKYVYAREYEAAGTENLAKYLYSVNRYEKLNGFKDSKARSKAVLENSYAFGTEKFELGDYTDAANVFLCLTKNGKILEETYSDSAEMHDYANAHFALEKSGDDIEKMLSAAVGFDQMKGFKKSAEKAEEIRLNVYTIGETALENGKYETAQACFEAQKDYKDSEEMVGYTLARAFEAENAGTDDGKISAAITYEKLNGFRDSGDRAEKMRGEIYKKAENALENGEYENAETLFAMQDYKDSKNMAQYAKAVGAEAKSGKNDVKKIDAAKEFEKLGDFKDSAKRAAALREDVYQKAEKAFSNRNYLNAIRLYTIQDYKDSKTMVDYARAASLEFEGKHADAAEEFEKLGEFRDSAEKAASLRQGIYDRAVKALNSGKYKNAIELFASQDYLDSKDMIVYTENMIIYDGAAAYAAKGMPVKAAEAYESLGEFKDSAEKAASIRKDIYDRAVKALEEGKYDESAKLFASQDYEDSEEMISYVNAAKLLSEGKNTEAATAYEAMGEFKDSAEKAASIRKNIYDRAVKALEEGKYDESAKLFASQDYEDSEEMISYVNAAKLLSEGKNTEAASAYEAMGEFRDSAEKAASIRKDIYDRAVKALEEGKYDESAKLFASQDYEDSEEMISYVNAAKLESNGKFIEAAEAFEDMGDFRDSLSRADNLRMSVYDKAYEALAMNDFDLSLSLFSSQDYKESKKMVSYVKASKLEAEDKFIEAAEAYEAMGEYMESDKKAVQIRANVYNQANSLFEKGNYAEAKALYALQKEYEDGADMCAYIDGLVHEQKEEYEKALDVFVSLSGFRDADDRSEASRARIYENAWKLADGGEYTKANEKFTLLGSYKDSENAASYVSALRKMNAAGANAEEYVGAKESFASLGNYKDSADYVKKIDKLLFMRFVDEISVFSENGLAAFRKNGKWGFINTEGNVVVSAQYDQVYAYTEGLAAVKLAGSWGFIDENGDMVIQNKYASVRSFSSGMAWVKKESGSSYWWFINQSGKESRESYSMRSSAVPEDFDGNYAYVNCYYDSDKGTIDKSGKIVSCSHLSFSEGISVISEYESFTYTYGYMNENGDIISEVQWQEAKPFTNGFAVVKKNGMYGLIDKTGKLVIDCKYSSVNSPKNGICLVSLNGKYGYVSVKGTTVSPVNWTYAYDYTDGLALVWKDGYYGYIGTDGQTKIAFTWDEASSFENGYACVKQYGSRKFIDKEGNIVMTLSKEVIEVLGSYTDPAILLRNAYGKYGYCAKDGAMLTDFKYNEAYGFSCGLARVKSGDYYGYIDETGKEVIPFKYYSAMDFSDDIALVQNSYYTDYFYIDKNMNVIYQTDTIDNYDIHPFIGGTAFVRKDYGNYFFLIDKNGSILTKEIYNNISESNMSYDDISEGMYAYMLESGEIPTGMADTEKYGTYAYVSIPSLTESGIFPSNTKFRISRTGEILAFNGHETSPVYAKKINGAWYLTNFEGDILV